MTLKEIRQELDRIKNMSGDNEAAHVAEDDLYVKFIDYVSHTADGDLAKKAKLVLTSEEIEFTRWYA